MMQKTRARALLVILLFLALVPFLHAFSLTIDPVDDALYVEYFFDHAPCSFQVPLPEDAKIISINDAYGPLPFSLQNNAVSITPRECDGIVFVKYKTSTFLTTNAQRTTITFFPPRLSFLNLTNISVVVRLPASFSLDALQLISPVPRSELVDDHWLFFFTLMPNETLVMQYNHGRFSWVWFFLSAGFLFLFIFLFLRYYRSWSKFRKIRYLDPYEQQVMRFLITKGSTTQQQLYHQIGLKKSHLSKVIDRLKRKGLIEKQKQGKINHLTLGPRMQ